MSEKLCSMFINDQEIKYNPEPESNFDFFPENSITDLDDDISKAIAAVAIAGRFKVSKVMIELLNQGKFEAIILLAINALDTRINELYESE